MGNSFTQAIAKATKEAVLTARDNILKITGRGEVGDSDYIKGEDMTDPLNGFMLQQIGAGLNSSLGAGSAIIGKQEKGNDQVIQALR